MVNRKRDRRKSFYLSDEEKKDAEDLKESIRLGLVSVPKDHELYNAGVRTYKQEMADIRAELDGQTPEKVNPAVPKEWLDHFRSANDAAPKGFMTEYQRTLARFRGEKVEAQDEYGFKAYPDLKPENKQPHGLDGMYLTLVDRSPELQGILEYYSLTPESWAKLLPETRGVLRSLYAEKTRFGV